MAIQCTGELMGPGFFVFFRQEVELEGTLGRAGQGKVKDRIKEDDEDFIKLMELAVPEILKHLRR